MRDIPVFLPESGLTVPEYLVQLLLDEGTEVGAAAGGSLALEDFESVGGEGGQSFPDGFLVISCRIESAEEHAIIHMTELETHVGLGKAHDKVLGAGRLDESFHGSMDTGCQGAHFVGVKWGIAGGGEYRSRALDEQQ